MADLVVCQDPVYLLPRLRDGNGLVVHEAALVDASFPGAVPYVPSTPTGGLFQTRRGSLFLELLDLAATEDDKSDGNVK